MNSTTTSTDSLRLTFDDSSNFTKDVKIIFDIPEIRSASLFSYDDATKKEGDFVAYLRIDYTKSGTTQQPKIKVTSVQGNWKCTSTSFSARFENKDVLLKQGNWLLDRCTLNKAPSGNSFNYTTGWGYVDDLPKSDYSGIYACSTAKAVINGMGGGYTIETKVTH